MSLQDDQLKQLDQLIAKLQGQNNAGSSDEKLRLDQLIADLQDLSSKHPEYQDVISALIQGVQNYSMKQVATALETLRSEG